MLQVCFSGNWDALCVWHVPPQAGSTYGWVLQPRWEVPEVTLSAVGYCRLTSSKISDMGPIWEINGNYGKHNKEPPIWEWVLNDPFMEIWGMIYDEVLPSILFAKQRQVSG